MKATTLEPHARPRQNPPRTRLVPPRLIPPRLVPPRLVPPRLARAVAVLRALALALALVGVPCLSAHAAQDSPTSDNLAQPPALPLFGTGDARDLRMKAARVDFGLSGTLRADRSGIITVWLTARDAPWSGDIEVTYESDTGQQVRRVAAGASPGRVTPVEIVVSLSRTTSEVTITAIDDRRATTLARAEVGFGQRFVGQAQRTVRGVTIVQLPLTQFEPVVAVLGDSSLARAASGRMGLARERPSTDTPPPDAPPPDAPPPPTDLDAPPSNAPESEPPPSNITLPIPGSNDSDWQSVRVDVVARVPSVWIAWDQADVVVATGSALEAMGERRREALIAWVRAGGRLIVQVDTSGREWAVGGLGTLVTIGDQAQVPLPPGVARVLGWEEVAQHLMAIGRYLPPPSSRPPGTDVSGRLPRAFAHEVTTRANALETPTIRARRIAVSDMGKSLGWRTWWVPGSVNDGHGPDWPTREGRSDAQSPDRAGLVAAGPLGAGIVTIVGIDPALLAPRASTESTIALWRTLTAGPLARALEIADSRNTYAYYGTNPASAQRRQWLESTFTGTAPPASLMALGVLALAMALAACISLVDAIVLRRARLRHRSHRTAIAWIALAAFLAFLLPLTLRSADDSASRIGAITAIVDDPTIDATWTSGNASTLLYAGGGGVVSFDSFHRDAWVERDRLQPLNYWESTRAANAAPSSIRQVAASANPGATGAAGPAGGAGRLAPSWMGQWTLRTADDEWPGEVDGPHTARADDVAVNLVGDEWRVTLGPSWRGAYITGLRLIIAGATYPVTVGPSATTAATSNSNVTAPPEPGPNDPEVVGFARADQGVTDAAVETAWPRGTEVYRRAALRSSAAELMAYSTDRAVVVIHEHGTPFASDAPTALGLAIARDGVPIPRVALSREWVVIVPLDELGAARVALTPDQPDPNASSARRLIWGENNWLDGAEETP